MLPGISLMHLFPPELNLVSETKIHIPWNMTTVHIFPGQEVIIETLIGKPMRNKSLESLHIDSNKKYSSILQKKVICRVNWVLWEEYRSLEKPCQLSAC